MQEFVASVGENRKLQYLSIANNCFIERVKDQNTANVERSEQLAIEIMQTFLKQGKRLVHLNLTSTNLSEKLILSILPQIKRAKSLMGIHLSGNPGVT